MNFKKITIFILISFFLCSCFQDEVPSGGNQKSSNDFDFNDLESGFPLSEEEQAVKLDYLNKERCLSNVECSRSNIDRLVDEFTFRSGKLVLRGNLVEYDSSAQQWLIDENIEVVSFASNPEQMITKKESDIHKYTAETNKYRELISGVNINLDKPIKPIIVSHGKLGLERQDVRDPGLCDFHAAINFEKLSTPPWPKYQNATNQATSDYIWPPRTGFFNEDHDLFAGETLIICGEITLLNRTLKLEAKNIIFYNSHIKVMSDRDMPSGLRITAENIGYFGANLIESNIINRASGQKNAAAPTIDIGSTGIITKVQSSAPPKNNFENPHFLQILMAEHE